MIEFWHEHVGQLMAGGGVGLGATFLLLFKEMIRDTWNDYRTRKRDEARVAMMRSPSAGAAAAPASADRLGAEITHQLLAMMNTEMADRKVAEEKNFAILRDLLETVKALTSNVGSLQAQASTQTTLMQVLASRPSR